MNTKSKDKEFKTGPHDENVKLLEEALLYLGEAHVEGQVITNPIVVSKAYYLLIELHKELIC